MFDEFIRDRRGNIAIIFSFMVMTLAIIGGGAADYVYAVNARSRLQDAVDATTLALANQHSSGDVLTATDTATAQKLLPFHFDARYGTLGAITAGSTTSSVTTTASATTKTVFLRVIAIPSFTFTATSTVVWSNNSLEVALVLDNTGSMASSGKMDALKTAATNMIESLKTKVTSPYTLKFSLVPFSNFVKVGSTYASASWIDQGATARSSYYDSYFSAHVNRMTAYAKLGKTWPGCVETRPSPYDIDETAPSLATPDTLFVPSFYPDEPDTTNGWPNSYMKDQTSYYSSDWTRLVYAAKYTSPSGTDFSNQTFFGGYPYPKGPGFMCDVQPLQRLTTDYSSLESQISAMKAVGSTNIPEGIAWGWRTLSPKTPFADGAAYSDGHTIKIMVLLTDGTNAISTWDNAAGGLYSSWGYPVSNRLGSNAGTDLRNGLDAKTRAVCTKVKAAGVQVYTIGLMIDDSAGQQMLSDCSSGPAFYYNSPSASQLGTIFTDIAKKISKMRIAS